MAMLDVVNAHQSRTRIIAKNKENAIIRKTVGIPPLLSLSTVNKITPTDGVSSRRSRQDSAIGHNYINIVEGRIDDDPKMTHPRIRLELGSKRRVGQVVARLIPC